jgi:hypothetical protein
MGRVPSLTHQPTQSVGPRRSDLAAPAAGVEAGLGGLRYRRSRLPIDPKDLIGKSPTAQTSPKEGIVSEYIQIVEYEADDIDAVIKTANSVPVPHDVPKPSSVLVVRDRDRPGKYATILRFDSYEDAMRHSESDATHERVTKLGSLMKGETRFYNLDILDEMHP